MRKLRATLFSCNLWASILSRVDVQALKRKMGVSLLLMRWKAGVQKLQHITSIRWRLIPWTRLSFKSDEKRNRNVVFVKLVCEFMLKSQCACHNLNCQPLLVSKDLNLKSIYITRICVWINTTVVWKRKKITVKPNCTRVMKLERGIFSPYHCGHDYPLSECAEGTEVVENVL